MIKRISSVGGGLLVTAGSAFAAVPADVTAALTDMESYVPTVGAAFVVTVFALHALQLMKRD